MCSLVNLARYVRVFSPLVAALFLIGCSPFVDQDQTIVMPHATVRLEPGHTVGQSFVARHGGLNGVEFWLEPEPGARGLLRLHLRSDPQSSTDWAVVALPLEAVTAPGFYRFSFALNRPSHGIYYYAFLEMEGRGAVRVGAASGEAYLDGAAYLDHQPLDAQLAFRLTYHGWGMALELGLGVLEGVGWLVIAALLYLVPGYAALSYLLPSPPPSSLSPQERAGVRETIPWPARMGLAAGLSLAFYPLLFLWTDLVGLHLGALYAWGPAMLGLATLAWRHRRWRPRQGWEAVWRWAHSEVFWPDFVFIFVMVLVLGVRWLVVRSLDAPMWGDAVQHAVIAQLLVDHGGLFDSWEPYAPYRGLTVHFGFHVVTALLAWATGMDIARSTLLAGQLLNGLAALTLYPLAYRIAGGNRWAGVGAVLVAGLLSPIPGYYVNWSRFAQLAGQVVLPVSLWLLWEAVERERFSWRAAVLAALALGGMVLHYYRMPFYYATFVLAWLVGWGLSTWGLNGHRWWGKVARMVLIAGVAIFLVSPWGSYVAGGKLASAALAGASAPTASDLEWVRAEYQFWRGVTGYVPPPLLIAAGAALLWSLIRRQWAVAACALWVAGLGMVVAGRLIRIPGANLMQNFAVLIALYMPVSLIVGWLLGEVVRIVTQDIRPVLQKNAGYVAAVLVFLVLSMIGFRKQMYILNPYRHLLVTRPDMRAMAWIRENTPSDALFLVEGFRIYNGRSAVGADAGWWIPLLARRANTMPPQYALFNETPIEPGYSQRVVDLVAHLEEHPPASPEGLARLCQWGITHVYIGQRLGRLGKVDETTIPLFVPDDFMGSPAFRLVYHQDRVWVFELNPGACGEVGS